MTFSIVFCVSFIAKPPVVFYNYKIGFLIQKLAIFLKIRKKNCAFFFLFFTVLILFNLLPKDCLGMNVGLFADDESVNLFLIFISLYDNPIVKKFEKRSVVFEKTIYGEIVFYDSF